MALESRLVPTNGIRIHTLSTGDPSGTPVVLVHGNSHCGGVWAPLMDSLATRGYRAIGVDLRGHGHSDKPQDGYEWEALREDIAGLLEALDLRDVLFVVHSRGGGVSLLATAYHPGRVRGIVAFEPTTPLSRAAPAGSNEPPPAVRMAQRTERRRTSFPSREFLFDYYRQRDQFKLWRDEYLRALIDYGCEEVEGGIERLCPGWVEGKLYQAMLDDTPWRTAPKSAIPLRLIYGEISGRIGPGRDPSAPVRAIFPDVEVLVMKGATHFGPMEQPEEFERLVLDFAGSIAP